MLTVNWSYYFIIFIFTWWSNSSEIQKGSFSNNKPCLNERRRNSSEKQTKQKHNLKHQKLKKAFQNQNKCVQYITDICFTSTYTYVLVNNLKLALKFHSYFSFILYLPFLTGTLENLKQKLQVDKITFNQQETFILRYSDRKAAIFPDFAEGLYSFQLELFR